MLLGGALNSSSAVSQHPEPHCNFCRFAVCDRAWQTKPGTRTAIRRCLMSCNCMLRTPSSGCTSMQWSPHAARLRPRRAQVGQSAHFAPPQSAACAARHIQQSTGQRPSLPHYTYLMAGPSTLPCLADYFCNLSVVDPLLLDQDPQHPGIEMLVFARQVCTCT